MGANGWKNAATAPDNVVVETKIDDEKVLRNTQLLKRRGRLWFFPDDSIYVYYTPTHYRLHTPTAQGVKS